MFATLSAQSIRAAAARASFLSDAYVWQRRWSPSLTGAIRASAPLLRALRVLAWEWDGRRAPVVPAVDWALLATTGLQTIATLRIGTTLTGSSNMLDRVTAAVHSLLEQVPRLVAIEVDHDSPTAALPEYSNFLNHLRGRLPGSVELYATALPTWLSSSEFPRFARATDELVMQVHALEGPLDGLFDPDRAYRWTLETARKGLRPFRIALPTYGSRAVLRSDGGILAIESEVPSGTGLAPGIELAVSPASVAGFLSRLERSPPAELSGLAWFRLPLPTDERAWSLTTWHALLRRETPSETATLSLRPTRGPTGLFDLVASADSVWDVLLPHRIELDAHCRLGDGTNGYTFRASPAPSFSTQDDHLLRAGRSRILGWVRCGDAVPQLRAIHYRGRTGGRPPSP